MLGVVSGRQLFVYLNQLGAPKHQTPALESSDDLAAEAAPNRIGLDQYECPLNSHQSASLAQYP